MLDRTVVAVVAECALCAAGIAVLVAELRRRRGVAPVLPQWNATAIEFVAMAGYAFGFWIAAGIAGFEIARAFHLSDDAKQVVAGGSPAIGLAFGVLVFHVTHRRALELRSAVGKALVSGAATFLVALPFIFAASAIVSYILEKCGVPLDRQPAIELFLKAKEGWVRGFFVLVAVIAAPIGEELIFRAGFFRYLRTRIWRPLALIAPALLFALLHQNLPSFAPLVVLAIVFSLAYERTGNIGTTIVAHALFNLNSLVLLYFGIDV